MQTGVYSGGETNDKKEEKKTGEKKKKTEAKGTTTAMGTTTNKESMGNGVANSREAYV